jgi:hypothetical protein
MSRSEVITYYSKLMREHNNIEVHSLTAKWPVVLLSDINPDGGVRRKVRGTILNISKGKKVVIGMNKPGGGGGAEKKLKRELAYHLLVFLR